MTDYTGITGATSATGSTSAAGSSTASSEIGKDEFFKMLMAQLKCQDPLNPMDGTEFTAQLAQFSSLEMLANINGTLEAQSASGSQLASLQAVSLIGREVEASIVDASTSTSATVTGAVTAVQFKDNSIYLTVNDQEISFNDVVSVK